MHSLRGWAIVGAFDLFDSNATISEIWSERNVAFFVTKWELVLMKYAA